MILSQKQKKDKSFSELNINATFDNNTVTSNAAYTYCEAFKHIIKFHELLKKNVSYTKASNAKYSTIEIIDFMIDANILGYSRFMHLDDLRKDVAYANIKNYDLPSEKVCRDLLKSLPGEALEELRLINKKLLELKSKNSEPREVMIDFDDTVCTIFGNQEGSACGYNPRYKGRPSFKEKVGVISGTHELLDVTLEEGTHHSNHKFIEFFESCINMLPSSWILKRIRTDRGFFDQKNFEYCESKDIEYITKVKMQSSVKKIIDYVVANPNDYKWDDIDKTFSVTEITIPLLSWDKARRFVLIRKTLPTKIEGQIVFDEFVYEYQAIVTNVDYMTPEEIFNDYNQRCNIENKIDEFKEGFAFDENSQIIISVMNYIY